MYRIDYLLLAFTATIIFSSCTSTKLVIDKDINQENLSSQLNNGDHIKVTTTENKTLKMRVNIFEESNIVGSSGSRGSEKEENVTVPYAEIDVIELKKVNAVKVVLGSALVLGGMFGLMALALGEEFKTRHICTTVYTLHFT